MKKASYDHQHATASDDPDPPLPKSSNVLPSEVPGLDVAASHFSARAFESNVLEVFPSSLRERDENIKGNITKHQYGPSRKSDDGIEPPPGSPVKATGMEAPNATSFPEIVHESHRPGVVHVKGFQQRPSSSPSDVDRSTGLHSEPQGESEPISSASLVEQVQEAEVVLASDLKPPSQSRSWKLLCTGGLIVMCIIVGIVVAVILSRPESDKSDMTLEALNPVLPESSKASIEKEGTPQFQAIDWLRGLEGVDSFLAERVRQLYALATLYFATSGDQWTNSTGWMENRDECSWYFSNDTIICNEDGLVTHLDLNSNNLVGVLPHDISILSNLTTLNLTLNKITGPMPSSISQLSKLRMRKQ